MQVKRTENIEELEKNFMDDKKLAPMSANLKICENFFKFPQLQKLRDWEYWSEFKKFRIMLTTTKN